MIYEDWDEGYDPPESATYSGGTDTPRFDGAVFVGTKPDVKKAVAAMQEQLDNERARRQDLVDAIRDIRSLLSRQHKMHYDEFITELSGIVTAAPIHPTTSQQNKDQP